MTYHNQVNVSAAREMMAAAFNAGINFFDNAEVYAGGQSETVMGKALKTLNWPRLNSSSLPSSFGAYTRTVRLRTKKTPSIVST